MQNIPKISGVRRIGSFRFVAVLGAVAVLLGVIGLLASDVRQRLASLDLANSDNGQWVMMQTEVEVLRLQTAISRARTAQTSVDDVRRWFNVLYSRLRMLEASPLYAGFIQKDENLARLVTMREFTTRWVETIDASDDVLLAALPAMEAQVGEVQRLARDLSLSSLLMFSASTDETRARMSETLVRLAVASVATLLLLGVLAAMAWRLHRTTQRQASENLLTSDRLQLIIATSPDAIVVTNRGGWVVEFNPAAEAMFGLRRDDVLGQQIFPVLFAPEDQDRYRAHLTQVVSDAARSGAQRFELNGRRADGQLFPLEISLATRDLNRGSLIIGFLRDVTQRNANRLALEQALTRAQAGEKAKAEFLTVMSHEMRTPLNGLIGSMELMQDTALNDRQRELLRVMEVSGEILLGHVNSVLDISRTEAGQTRLLDMPFVLERLIDDCIANQAGVAQLRGNVIRHLSTTGPLGRVRGDAKYLQQILLNLIGNAVKFTQGGTITVETERLPHGIGAPVNPMVELRVIDTGIGIAKADQRRIFEDFAMLDTTLDRRTGGTGLGLGIARRLVQAMGGSLGVESEPGKGSVFWLRLPLPPAEPVAAETPRPLPLPAAPPTADPADMSAPSLTVLIIEDNDINRFLLRNTLCALSHRVTEAVDGLEGVEIAAQQRFDLIVTDLSMPRLDGIEAARRIRAGGASAQARIVALTAHALPADPDVLSAAGIDTVLTKPIKRDALLAALFPASLCVMPQTGTEPLLADTQVVIEDDLRDLTQTVGPKVAASLLTRMLDEGDDTLRQFRAEATPGEDMARVAHQLAGSCTTFGAIALRSALADLERAIHTGDADHARDVLADLPNLWHATRQTLAAHRDSLVA